MRARPLACIIAAVLLIPPVACSPRAAEESVRVSREALGTVVTIEAWGADKTAVDRAIDDAFVAIADVERELDAYSTTSSVSAFNKAPYRDQPLPPDAVEVLDAIDRLEVAEEFSPGLLAVVRLYDFPGSGRVPSAEELALATAAARAFVRTPQGTAHFERLADPDPRLDPGAALAPGLDFGGAAKGLALDRARDALHARGAVTAAIVSSGSTTVTLGDKPDGEPWRVGVEDARQPGVVIARAEWHGEAALSTSGDYQQFFERDGVRYHHILDPDTGRPARGVRTLTVAGRISGLESDILSTALFVRGREGALAYARAHGVGLFLTDSEGRAHLAPAPADSGVLLSEE
ncbi:MAG: FAD:protein FMN transferase [Actinomycetia bacterium]|nr:FAD:protein FMN transferase [Actinomycetes bacterium]